jgi:hypothetical protein
MPTHPTRFSVTFPSSAVLVAPVVFAALWSACSANDVSPAADGGQRSDGSEAISPGSVALTIDVANDKGALSSYFFTSTDGPFLAAQGYDLAKAASVQAIGFDNVSNSLLPYAKEKAQFLADNGMEAIIYFDHAAPLSEDALQSKAKDVLDRLESLANEVSGFSFKVFIFGNEPDLPTPLFWKGTKDEFYRDYAVFARYVKSRNPAYIVGSPGFAATPDSTSADALSADTRAWVEGFLAYMDANQVPLDVLNFHGYSSEVRTVFTERVGHFKAFAAKHPGLSPLFGTPKVACPEWDTIGGYDSAWKAAHNVIALGGLIEGGAFMSVEKGGCFENSSNAQAGDPSGAGGDAARMWVTGSGLKKPNYYAHQALGALAGATRLAVDGVNGETLGALAGRAEDGSVAILLANYDEKRFLELYPNTLPPLPGVSLPTQRAAAVVYQAYALTLKNLPWPAGSKVRLERFLVDDQHHLESVESTDLTVGSTIAISRSTTTPEVQLLKLKAGTE